MDTPNPLPPIEGKFIGNYPIGWVPDAPDIAGTVPGQSQSPATPRPESPETPEAPETPETLEIQDSTGITEAWETLETPETSETPDVSEAGEAWETSKTPETSEISESPETRDEWAIKCLKKAFAEGIQKEIDEDQENRKKDPRCRLSDCEGMKELLVYLSVLLEPLTELDVLNVAATGGEKPIKLHNRLLDIAKTYLILSICLINELWSSISAPPDRPVSSSTGTMTARNNGVLQWYRSHCPLTGAQIVQAEQHQHIIPLRAKTTSDNLDDLWWYLEGFFPFRGDPPPFTEEMDEKGNILPLDLTTRWLWDRNRLGLRPILHPTEPQTRMYLQVVWFPQRHIEIGLDADDNNESTSESTSTSTGTGAGDEAPTATAAPTTKLVPTDLFDKRRVIHDEATGAAKGAELICHGDVYELHTPDCKARPLPDIRLLQMRFAMQQLLAPQQCPAALRIIFGVDPPASEDGDDGNGDGDGDTKQGPDEKCMPAEWDRMLDDALRFGILTLEQEQAWRRHILKEASAE